VAEFLGERGFATLLLDLLPRGNTAHVRLSAAILTRTLGAQFEPRIFYNEFPGKILYVADTDARGEDWRGVFLGDSIVGPEEPADVWIADRGSLELSADGEEVALRLQNAVQHSWDLDQPDRVGDLVRRVLFRGLDGQSVHDVARAGHPPGEHAGHALVRQTRHGAGQRDHGALHRHVDQAARAGRGVALRNALGSAGVHETALAEDRLFDERVTHVVGDLEVGHRRGGPHLEAIHQIRRARGSRELVQREPLHGETLDLTLDQHGAGVLCAQRDPVRTGADARVGHQRKASLFEPLLLHRDLTSLPA